MVEPPRSGDAGWDCHVHVFDAGVPVRAGHYVPPHRPLAAIEGVAAAEGLGRLVIVQPSVYGTDNAVLLRALAAGGGRHRGIVVVDPAIADAELDRLHAAGVRGVRVNRVSPVGDGDGRPQVAERVRALAPRLAARGWHLQWYAEPAEWAWVATLHGETGLTGVLDHLAGCRPATATDAGAARGLDALAEAGAWIKLSGWYRLGIADPYDEAVPLIRHLARRFEGRCVYGSDWPHTSFAPGTAPAYARLRAPVRAALGAEGLAALDAAARRLYD